MSRTALGVHGALSAALAAALALSACLAFDDTDDSPGPRATRRADDEAPAGEPQAPSSSSTKDPPDAEAPTLPQPADAGAPDAAQRPRCAERDPAPWDGKHRAGASCTEGCHDGRALAGPAFTFGGTVYSKPTGGVPVAGATILVTDARGRTLTLTSGQNGNFYTREPLAFPLRVAGSLCPSSSVMAAPVTATGGAARTSCNGGGCHDAGRRTYLGAAR